MNLSINGANLACPPSANGVYIRQRTRPTISSEKKGYAAAGIGAKGEHGTRTCYPVSSPNPTTSPSPDKVQASSTQMENVGSSESCMQSDRGQR
jgi:hypothetical protein